MLRRGEEGTIGDEKGECGENSYFAAICGCLSIAESDLRLLQHVSKVVQLPENEYGVLGSHTGA